MMFRLFNIVLLFSSIVYAHTFSLDGLEKKVELLSQSEIAITSYQTTLDTNITFIKHHENHINLGPSPDKSLWISFELKNQSLQSINYFLEIDNPILEHITLYTGIDDNNPLKQGILHRQRDQETIYPYFDIQLEPKQSKTFYLQIQSKTTTLQLSLQLIKKELYVKEDKKKQFNILLFIGIITGFFIYGLSIFVYTKNVSYMFYSFYLLALSYQQLTYVGFLPLYTSDIFTSFDNNMTTIKGGVSIILSAYFSRNFLKVSNNKYLNRAYNAFIVMTLVFMLLFSTPWFYQPEFIMVTGLIFIFFNEFVAIYMYRQGNKEARFFIVGWTFVMIGYTTFLLDIFGFFSAMYSMPTLVLWATAFEALMLLLAFVDNVNILQKQRNELSQKLTTELQERHDLIEIQVKERTKELQTSLKEKQTLYKELHHRVKNNLQIIISLIRLQFSELSDPKLLEPFEKLESRIKAMAKTHEFLYQSDKINKVSMYDYLLILCDDIEDALGDENIEFHLDVNAFLPFNEALYVGLIVNEFIYNAYKYRYDNIKVVLSIVLYKKEQKYIMQLKDNGLGFKNDNEKSPSSLGLKLIQTLVENQLKGTLEMNSTDGMLLEIMFKA